MIIIITSYMICAKVILSGVFSCFWFPSPSKRIQLP